MPRAIALWPDRHLLREGGAGAEDHVQQHAGVAQRDGAGRAVALAGHDADLDAALLDGRDVVSLVVLVPAGVGFWSASSLPRRHQASRVTLASGDMAKDDEARRSAAPSERMRPTKHCRVRMIG